MKYYDYRGHKDIAFIYYNEWADPRIEYRGFQWSAWEVEDALEYDYNEVKCDDSESLQDYMKDPVKDLLTEWLYSLGEIDIDYIYKYAPQNYYYLKTLPWWCFENERYMFL